MKKISLLLLPILLASCSSAPAGPLTMPLQERLRNPLVAERYWAELTEHMADFVRTKDPITKDPIKASAIDSQRLRALDRVAEARKLKDEGVSTSFLHPNDKEPTDGGVLLLNHTLYFGSDFIMYPSPTVHVYLTMVIDPREGSFPDKTAVDIGELQTPYGAQEYAIPDTVKADQLRTVVLYDTTLSRLVGFAQLR